LHEEIWHLNSSIEKLENQIKLKNHTIEELNKQIDSINHENLEECKQINELFFTSKNEYENLINSINSKLREKSHQ